MDHHPVSQLMTRRLAIAAVIAAGLAATACEPRPRDPKPPKDPGRNVPKPVTTASGEGTAALPAFRNAR